jgi:hypothetical protein
MPTPTIKVPENTAIAVGAVRRDADNRCWRKLGTVAENPTATLNSISTFSDCTDCRYSNCPSGNPEILGTVFDADYAGGNINWAGKTWTPAEVQAGATKILCPDTYNKFSTLSITPSYSKYIASHT